jgi:hypothetical protein
LGDEHIIPLSIGGSLILSEASCKRCERITSQLEDRCTKTLFDYARPHLDIRARKQKKPRTHAYVDSHTAEQTKVPIENHPGTIRMFKFAVPGILLGLGPNEDFPGHFILRPVVTDFRHRVIRGGNQFRFQIGSKVVEELFRRMLAKIGHAYAVAELGLGGFQPFLPNLILGEAAHSSSYLVGGGLLDEPRTCERHQIEINRQTGINGQKLVVVRIRIFGDLDMPSHYVVAGTEL